MSSDILVTNLFETDRKVDPTTLGQTIPYRPRISAEVSDSRVIDFYSELIGERSYKLPRHFGDISSRLGGYRGNIEDLLKISVYTIKPEEENLGGYFDPNTGETALNANLAYSNRRFARHATTHEMVHKIQKNTGALNLYTDTLIEHYGELYGKFGRELEELGFKGAEFSMRIQGEMVGLSRARAIIEGSASAATSRYEREASHDAYEEMGWSGCMNAAIGNLGYGAVLAPKSRGEVLAVDSYLD